MKYLGIVGAVVVVALAFVGGAYDYSSLIAPGTLLTDLGLMVTAALTIAVGARFAFKGARFALRAIGLIK